MDRIIVIIPVKSNSKRLERKNFRSIAGKYLWEWSLSAASNTNIKKKIYIITEGEDIIRYLDSASKDISCYDNNVYGYPNFSIIIRPDYLAEDPYEIKDTCLWFLGGHKIEAEADNFDTMIMLQPSNPLVLPEDITNAYNLFIENNRTCVRSVCRMQKSALKSFYISDKTIEPAHPSIRFLSDIDFKDLPVTYQGNGSIVVADIKQFLKYKTLYLEPTIGYVMPPERSIDIDTESDFKLAEFLLKERLNGINNNTSCKGEV